MFILRGVESDLSRPEEAQAADVFPHSPRTSTAEKNNSISSACTSCAGKRFSFLRTLSREMTRILVPAANNGVRHVCQTVEIIDRPEWTENRAARQLPGARSRKGGP